MEQNMKKQTNKSRITAIIKTEILSQYSQEYLKNSKKKSNEMMPTTSPLSNGDT